MSMSYQSDVAIQQISFRPDNIIEVTYAEQRDISDHATLVKLLMFDRDLAPQMVDELVDLSREVVDAVLVAMRGDPMKIAGRQ